MRAINELRTSQNWFCTTCADALIPSAKISGSTLMANSELSSQLKSWANGYAASVCFKTLMIKYHIRRHLFSSVTWMKWLSIPAWYAFASDPQARRARSNSLQWHQSWPRPPALCRHVVGPREYNKQRPPETMVDMSHGQYSLYGWWSSHP